MTNLDDLRRVWAGHTVVLELIDEIERLQMALRLATRVIESYQMDLRNSAEILSSVNLDRLAEGESLADIGFCQGVIYTDALRMIRRVTKGDLVV